MLEKRRQARYKLRVDMKVYSRKAGHISGYTLDLSESGMSAMLLMELELGDLVGLDFKPAVEPVHVWAVVRNRVAFRYGFEFVRADLSQEQIKRACALLAASSSGDSERV
jgi:hypothetical protein